METVTIRHPLAADTVVPEEELWSFPDGLIGFPDLTRFALLDLEQAPPFRLLASIDEPAFGLVVVDPLTLVKDYELAIAEEDIAPLGETDPAGLQVVVTVQLPTERTPMALSLHAPFILCPAKRIGVQRASSDESHAVRYRPDRADSNAPSCSS
jgi:flagellar assembly factor FliW